MPDNDKEVEDQILTVLSKEHIWEDFRCYCDNDDPEAGPTPGYPSFKCRFCGAIYHKEKETDMAPPERAFSYPCSKTTIKR